MNSGDISNKSTVQEHAMKTASCCKLCSIQSGHYQFPIIDEPFASNDDFLAIASIGAFVEGWTLIVPRVHQLSLRKVYGTEAFVAFASTVLKILSKTYGPVIAFEHGSNAEGSLTGCGTNHAHLHLVPFRHSLVSALTSTGLHWQSCRSSELDSIIGSREYLFYADLNEGTAWKNPSGYLHILEVAQSQFFRRLIAKDLGLNAQHDYKAFPRIETARLTRQSLVAAVA